MKGMYFTEKGYMDSYYDSLKVSVNNESLIFDFQDWRNDRDET